MNNWLSQLFSASPTTVVAWLFLICASCNFSTCSLNAQEEYISRFTDESIENLVGPYFHISDQEHYDSFVQQAAMLLQQTPLVIPRTDVTANSMSPSFSPSSGPASNFPISNLRVNSSFGAKDFILGSEGLSRASRDLGDLLRKSPAALSVGTQSRASIIHDPRIRGSRVGSLSASGSHWIPARADLDTILSKFDSRQVESVDITPGPFTSLLGPGFDFTAIRMLQSPRYAGGQQWHGSTDADYRSNGNQFFGQQSVLTGGHDWGARFNYGYRTGDDYSAGNGQRFPSSYDSQEMTFALGKDWRSQSIEFSLLRLDQNDVEFPGYVFDIEDLVTDGYQITHQWRDAALFDVIETQAWYNRTHLDGNAQNQAKRVFFPLLDLIRYVGRTDVDALSTGYRQSFALAGGEDHVLTIGHDLRYTGQELNEISSGVTLGLPLPITNRNSPIPKSFSANPGVFTEYLHAFADTNSLRVGGRLDYAHSDINDDPEKLQEVGLDLFPASYAEIVGTSDYSRDFHLLSAFATLSSSSEGWTETLGLGYAERAPNLTELYAAQPFMLLMQNGLNNVTGDPSLKTEKLLQLDTSLEYRGASLRAGVRGFQSWAFDYITFENTRSNFDQVSLRYVNTDFATLTGFESFSEFFPASPLTPFINVRYVQGNDRTRNGTFATSNGSQGDSSQKITGLARGFFSGIVGGSKEPLPSISPLETHAGLRYQDTSDLQRFSIELTSRIVDNQSRVASSLLETPTPGFTTWDLRALLRPRGMSGLVVTTGIENFTNKNYREHLDFRAQNGRSVFQSGATFYLGSSLNY